MSEAMQAFQKLAELLAQDQFELLFPDKDAQEPDQIRLVYLMNDAVESFLVFSGARMTGQYQPDYEGELDATLSQEEGEYVLVVYQGDTVVTIFFRELFLESHLYNYGDVGHFWVKGYEYLRLLEYRLAILHDKYKYLGEEVCSRTEKKLATLVHFPPLNYSCYPAVPEKYIVPMEEPWNPTNEAIEVMLELAKEADDQRMQWWLALYKKHHGKWMTRWIASILHRSQHADMIEILDRKLAKETKKYPNRSFGKELNLKYAGILAKAEKRKEELEAEGTRVTLVREEPFAVARDLVDYKVYLMIWKKGWLNQTVTIETF